MKGMGYGDGYKYDHDFPEHFAGQQHLPDSLKSKRFYEPGDQGYEKQVGERLKTWWESVEKAKKPKAKKPKKPTTKRKPRKKTS